MAFGGQSAGRGLAADASRYGCISKQEINHYELENKQRPFDDGCPSKAFIPSGNRDRRVGFVAGRLCGGTPAKFTYDAINDGWNVAIDLLAYAYGDSDRMLKESVEEPRGSPYKDGKSLPPRTGINGPMPVGEFLYVRWRVKATGQVYEERVDLRERLPADMKDHGLTFVIDGPQLYVYVITPRPKPYYEAPPLNRSWRSKSYVTYEIFPTLTKP